MINFYVPSEYEEMLLVAGWITLEDVDDQYIEYRKRATRYAYGNVYNDHLMSHYDWTTMLLRKRKLDTRYMMEVEPYYQNNWEVPEHIQKLHHKLIREISEIETVLGY